MSNFHIFHTCSENYSYIVNRDNIDRQDNNEKEDELENEDMILFIMSYLLFLLSAGRGLDLRPLPLASQGVKINEPFLPGAGRGNGVGSRDETQRVGAQS